MNAHHNQAEQFPAIMAERARNHAAFAGPDSECNLPQFQRADMHAIDPDDESEADYWTDFDDSMERATWLQPAPPSTTDRALTIAAWIVGVLGVSLIVWGVAGYALAEVQAMTHHLEGF